MPTPRTRRRMGAGDTFDKAEKASNFLTALLTAVQAHPFVFVFVMVMIAIVIAFLPNGPVKAYIEHVTEMRKLNARASAGKQKLISGRQNRRSGR